MIQKIIPSNRPKIIKQQGNLATFEIEPCSPGYGITLGYALRRVLLSSLPGTAVTEVKIDGVAHEFSSIPFVKQDVIQIILNLKKLTFKLYGDEPVIVSLKGSGEKELKAADIKAPSNVEIVNKNLLIASLTSPKAKLDIEIKLEKGLGYVPVRSRVKEKRSIGTIALDANFSPIKKINYNVENIRVGTRTDFNKLILEIETDGTISPKDAFIQASDLLINQFSVFANPKKVKSPVIEQHKKPKKRTTANDKAKQRKKTKKSQKQKKNAKVNMRDLASKTIDDLNIDPRIIKTLHKARIKSISNLAKKSEEYLLGLDDLGPKSVKLIRRELGKFGVILRESQK